jgi:lipopolysaccharide/colanic/teichoic acid biosynthesis glycosyltransferase
MPRLRALAIEPYTQNSVWQFPLDFIPEKKVGDLYRTFGKRLFDLVAAAAGLVVLAPVLVLVAVLVRLDSAGPALFIQERLGKNGKVFRAYKFRTMTHRRRDVHQEIFGKTDEVTRIGYWLRRFKIDELPQLMNVLKGDMSVVGPRPALPSQLSQYNDTGKRRLCVRPGLTGLAQIHGNIHLSWPQRWVYDAKYVDELSLGMDLWIILRTFAVIWLGEEKFLDRTPSESNP